MKPLLPILKAKLVILSFVFVSTAILANNYIQRDNPFRFSEPKEEQLVAEPAKIPVKTKRVPDKKLNLLVRDNIFRGASSFFEAIVQTDKPDYYPGDFVIITGSGWDPGEIVSLHIVSDCGCTNEILEAEADSLGNIYNDQFEIMEWHLGASFVLTATGLSSGLTDETTFTDGPKLGPITPITQQGGTICAGTSTNVTFNYTVTRGQNTDGNVTADITISGLPAGVNVFSGLPNNGVDIPETGYSSSFVLTVANTVGAGNYNFTMTANGPGNDNETGTGTLVISVNNPPGISANGTTLTLGCNPSSSDINGALGSATATDDCGTPTITSSDGSVNSNGCSRSQTRTFTATDNANLTATTSRTVTWIDDVTPPGFTGSYTDVNLGCNPATDPVASLGSATATDACGTITNISSSDGSVVSDGCNRSITRTFTATDGCLNTSTTSRTIRWIVDVTPPGFTGSYADVNLGCNPITDPVASLGTATATDACGAITNIQSSDGAMQSDGCHRWITRTFTATDGCLNTSTTSRTVRWIHDLTPPGFTGSYADVNLGCNPANPSGSLGSATATDACGAVTNIQSSDGAMQSDGCNRWITRTFTATDGCLNTSTTSRTVRWIVDLTPPGFTTSFTTVPLSCNPSSSAITAALGTATATDACGAVTVTHSDGTVSSSSCSRSQTRTFIAKDGCNNTSTASRTVTWIEDLTSPTIPTTFVSKTCLWPPNHKMVDIELAASDGCGSIATSSITITSNEPANDIGDGNTEVDWEIVDGNSIRLRAERSGNFDLNPTDFGRIYTINYSVTDGCGNTASRTNTVTVAHNITQPKPGCAYPINTTVNFGGTFWDVPGKTHTAKWVVDGTTVNGTVTLEPNGNKMGKVTGSFKPTVAGVYKLRMNVIDQTGITSYATTSGDYEAYFVAYDAKGGYTYGAGQYISPAGALPAQPNLSEVVTFGFTSNYYKNATNPKGETQIEFKLTNGGDYSFAFNALNYDYLLVDGPNSSATYKGLGKTIINGVEQSGLAFIMKVIDNKTPANPDGVDKIRMKIYNKNTGAVIYDNQIGDPETAEPTTPVDEPNDDGSDIVVVSTPATSADITLQNAQMEIVPEITKFNVKAFPNPSQNEFNVYLEGATDESVSLIVYDALGRKVKQFEKQGGNIPIHFGRDLKGGIYILEVRQGKNSKTVRLIKQN